MRPPAIERMGYYPTDEPVVRSSALLSSRPRKRGGYLILRGRRESRAAGNGAQLRDLGSRTLPGSSGKSAARTG